MADLFCRNGNLVGEKLRHVLHSSRHLGLFKVANQERVIVRPF